MKKISKRITPNEGQVEALALMNKFKKSKTTSEFCLDGVGGTGKTTLIKELFIKANKKIPDDFYVASNVIGVTVSHKARLVLSEHLPNCITYAAAVNMTIEFDAWGEMVFVPKNSEFKQSKLYKYKYIVFDEASMVSEEMRTILNFSCHPGSKTIYLGDHHQLPPIKPRNGNYDPDADSLVFSLPDKYTLTQKMRQNDGDHIAELCDITCEHIDGDQYLGWMSDIKQKYSDNKGYSFSTEEKVLKSFVNNFTDGVNCRITSYRNKRVDYLNYHIRRRLFDIRATQPYVIGELLVGNDIYNPNNDPEPIYFNGEDLVVENIGEQIVDDIWCHQLWIVGKKSPVYVIMDKDQIKYNARLSQLKNKALRKKEWHEYMQFKCQFANLSYGYAITLYKVQGTTLYGNYMDISDVYGVKPLSNKRKLQSMYVGFSRPTNFLALF